MTDNPAPTKAPESPPQAGLQPDPAPTPPSSGTPAPGPGPEAGSQPEGGVAGAEAGQQPAPEDGSPPSGWWTSPESAEALWEHEEAKSRLEQSDREGFKRGRTETQQRMQGFLQKQTHHLSSIDGGVQRIVRDFNKLAKSEDADAQAISNILDEHAGTFEALQGVHQEAGKWVGAKGVMAEMGKALEDSGFYTEFSERLDGISQGMTDPTLFPDIVERISKAAVKQAMEKERTKIEKQVRERVEAELRAEARSDGKPPAKPVGGGGAGALTVDAWNAKTPAEKAAVPKADAERIMNEKMRRQ